MTVWTFKTSSDFGNKLLLDIPLDSIDCFDDVEDRLSSMELRSGTGSPDTSVTESLNTLWQNMLKEKTQELDGINRFGKRLTVTVLGKLMGPETKRDVLSIVRKDVAFRKETSLRVGSDILDGVDAVSNMFDINDASFVECLLRNISGRFQRIDSLTESCGKNRFDGFRMKEKFGISEMNPTRGIRSQCATGNNDMDMGMEVSVTSPGLVGHEECGFSVELGIENLFYGIRNGFEKDTDCFFGLTTKNDSVFVRERERNEEIRNIEMLRHPGINPWNDFVLSAVRTIPVSAGAEPELHVSTMRAHTANPSRERSAAGKNVSDSMEDRLGHAMSVKEFGTMIADDVCETVHASIGQIVGRCVGLNAGLSVGLSIGLSVGSVRRNIGQVVGQLFDEFGVLSTAHLGIVNVVSGSSQVFVTEDVLNGLRTGVQLNEVRGTAMAEHVRSDALFDCVRGTDAVVQRLGFAERNVLCPGKNDFAGRLADLAEGKQEFRMSVKLPTLFEMSQHFSLDRDLPDLTTFSFDDQISVCPVDVMNREMGCFGITETAGVHQFGQNPEYQIVDQREKVFDFPLRQYFPVSPVFFRMKDVQERSEQIQSLLIQEQ